MPHLVRRVAATKPQLASVARFRILSAIRRNFYAVILYGFQKVGQLESSWAASKSSARYEK